MLSIKRSEILLGIILGAAIGVGLYYLIDLMPTLGKRIPNRYIEDDYVRGVFTAIGLMVCVFFIPCKAKERVPLLLIWGLRSFITLFVMLFYEYNYGLDAYTYFSRAVDMQFDLDGSHSMFKGTYLISSMARQLVEIFPFLASYHALKVFWSFLGFLGSYIFYRGYTNYSGESDVKLLYILGIFPSIIFWSSILGKDPITFFGISLAFYGSLPLFKKFSLFHVFIFLSGLMVAGLIRSWLIVIFFAPFILLYLFRSRAHISIKALVWAASVAAFLYFSGDLLTQIQVEDKSDAINTVARVSRSWSRGGSGQQVQSLGSTSEVVKFMPIAMFTALFRPFPGEVLNFFGTFAGFENTITFLLFLWALFWSLRYLRNDIFIQYTVVTLLVWSAFYGFISYQNLGTAVRFKLQVLPLMILIPYHVWQRRKVNFKDIQTVDRA